METLGSQVRANVNAVQTRLNGSPDSAEEWQTIAKQLRTASDKARKVAKFAEAMNGSAIVHGVDHASTVSGA